MSFDINIKDSSASDIEMEKLDFKLSINFLKKIEEICERNLTNQNTIQEYVNFLEDMNENFNEKNAPIIIDLLVNHIDIIKKWIESQKNTTFDVSGLKSYGRYINRMQTSLARPFAYSTLMASRIKNGVIYYHIIRNDSQSFILDLNYNEVLDFCGEMFRVISHEIKPDDVDRKYIAKFLSSNLRLLSKITGKSLDELLKGKPDGMDK